ncbi:hypothetical protein H0266_09980 [Halobacillus locisalis]|uniref:ABC transmembrane type-1 domain-containing protein n=1 Tax=Halobacillus locisalis TaxID=220753 RepID=A0A838CSW4_9BACI|nr:ABC transporter permease subunit [Halobacillus locisalis]MBA2175222.1 hypothetical protein [Halobacillus locisalis]
MNWIRFMKKEVLYPIYLMIGIFLISISPLFMTSVGLHWPGLENITTVFTGLLQPDSLTYVNPKSGVERELFPIIFKAFGSSFFVLSIALVLAFLAALVLSIVLRMLTDRLYKGVISIASLFQSVPDVVYVLGSQIILVWIYVELDLKFAKFTGAGEQEAILVPGIVLSILPGIFFLKSMLSMLEEEGYRPYVELAKGKGLHPLWITIVHMLRNLFVRLAFQLKFIISLMLSNLLIVEYLFNNFGMTTFLLSYSQPAVFFVTAIMFFIPVYIFLKGVEVALYYATKQEVSL